MDLDGASMNGNWTLFFANPTGADAATLNSWTLGLGDAPGLVPEPVNVALAIFGGAFGLVAIGRRALRKMAKR